MGIGKRGKGHSCFLCQSGSWQGIGDAPKHGNWGWLNEGAIYKCVGRGEGTQEGWWSTSNIGETLPPLNLKGLREGAVTGTQDKL